MTGGVCRDCSWYAPQSVERGYGECQAIGRRRRPGGSAMPREAWSEDLVFTLPDFGCVLFRAKRKEQPQ